jgi:hypothetical protein
MRKILDFGNYPILYIVVSVWTWTLFLMVVSWNSAYAVSGPKFKLILTF